MARGGRMNPALLGLMTIAIGVGGCIAYFYFSNLLLDKVLFPAKGPKAGRNITRANQIRPWLFLFPAFFALLLYLGYPVFETLRLSLTDRSQGEAFVGLANYRQMFSEPKFGEAIRNNMLWLIVVPAASTGFGLLVAQLTDRISWGNIAKSLIFMPMAISFVGASVIFKLIYDARPADVDQIGVLNAVWMQFDGGPGSVLVLKVMPAVLFLAFAALTGWVAWALVRQVLAGERMSASVGIKLVRLVLAALAGILALISLRQVFDVFAAQLPYGEPQSWLTLPFYNNFFLMVVLIWIQTGFAMVILSAALRGTQVLANYMYDKLFRANDWGVGSAAAIVIMLLVTPILVWNVYNARKEMR